MVQISASIPGKFVGMMPNSKNNTILYVSNNTQELITWDIYPPDWVKLICARVGRNLTLKEWHKFIGGIPYPTQSQAVCPVDYPVEPNHGQH